MQFREEVPEGKVFYKHSKSRLLHCAEANSPLLLCGAKLTDNFKQTERVLFVKLPKCMKCFPGSHNRIRTRAEMAEAIDQITKRQDLRTPKGVEVERKKPGTGEPVRVS